MTTEEQVNRLANAIIFTIQRQQNEIYRLAVANAALLEMIRQVQLKNGMTNDAIAQAFQDALAHAEQNAPRLHTDISKEIEEAVRFDPALENEIKNQN